MSLRRFVGYYLALTVCCVIAYPRWIPASASATATGRAEAERPGDTAGAAPARPYDVVCVLAKRVKGVRPGNTVVLTGPSGRPVFARYARPHSPGALPSIYFCRHIIDLGGRMGHPLGDHPLEIHAERQERNGALRIPGGEASLIQHLDEMGHLAEGVRIIVVLPSHA